MVPNYLIKPATRKIENNAQEVGGSEVKDLELMDLRNIFKPSLFLLVSSHPMTQAYESTRLQLPTLVFKNRDPAGLDDYLYNIHGFLVLI